MTLDQILIFSEHSLRRRLASRADFIQDVATAFHGTKESREKMVELMRNPKWRLKT